MRNSLVCIVSDVGLCFPLANPGLVSLISNPFHFRLSRSMRLKPFLLIVLIVITGCASPEQRVDKHARAAAKLIASSRYRRAWRELERARSIGVPCPQVDAIQGLMMARRRDLASAETLLTSAVNGLPSNYSARNNLAVVYLVSGRAPEALRVLEPSITSGVRQSALLNNYGIALRVCGESSRARKAFEQAMRANPRNSDATANYAMCLYQSKQLKDAVAAWETAVYIDESNPEAWAGLCIGRAAMGQQGMAKEAAFKAVMIDSSYVNQKMLINVRNWPRAAAAELFHVIRSIPRFRQGMNSPVAMKVNGSAQLMEDPLVEEARTAAR